MTLRHRALTYITEGLENLDAAMSVVDRPTTLLYVPEIKFSALNSNISSAIKTGDGDLAFELVHRELDKVWDESYRVLKPGGVACINNRRRY
mgnify:CR=1 FL=1